MTRAHVGAPSPERAALPSGLLQRACACGTHTADGGTCPACARQQRQRSTLTVGARGDPLEGEADRIADNVMAASAQHVAGTAPREVRRVTSGAAGSAAAAAPASVSRVLDTPGRPLDVPLRRHMEQRFGHEFSRVRIHADDTAARSAHDVGAEAYTVGQHIVFGAGRFGTSAGQRRLLAHELVHTLQQGGIAGAPFVQRKCQPDALGVATPACTPSEQGAVGWQLRFRTGCDDLLPGEEDVIRKMKVGSQLKIHGYASKEGDPAFNDELSCHRANRIAEIVQKRRADCPVIGIFRHGASPVSAPGVARDVNPPDFWRSVIIEEVAPTLESGEAWLDPHATIRTSWALYRRAAADPTPTNLMLVSAWRSEVKDWLTGIGRALAPPGAKLTTRNLDDYRRLYASAESLWVLCDNLLALHKHADAGKDTYAAWAVGPGTDQGDKLHLKNVPQGAKYHVDIFGEGFFKGAINIGMAERTTSTGIQGSRVPNLIYRRFSSKNANALPIADHTADLVTSEAGPIGYPGLAEEIARIIAPGGTVMLTNPLSEESAHDRVAKAVGGTVKREKTDRAVRTTIVAPGP